MGILIKAIKNGSLEEVKKIVETHPDLLFMIDQYGQSPLHYSAEIGNLDITKFLLDKGVEVNEDKSGHTPLLFACRYSHEEVVKLLLDNGLRDNFSIFSNFSLREAIENNNISIVRELIKYRHPIENYKEQGLFIACSSVGKRDIVKLLLDSGADINYQSKPSLYTPIMEAVEFSDIETVQLLRDKGANLKIKGRYGATVFDFCRRKEIKNILTSYKIEKVDRFIDF